MLLKLPVLAALPAYAAVFALIALGAHLVFRRFVPPEKLMEQHDVAGYLVAVVGVLYSVVLGFLVGTVWTAFAAAQETTNMEAGYVADAFGFAARWEQPKRAELLREIARYAVVVDDVELPPSGGERSDPRAPRLLSHAIDIALFAPAPKSPNPSVMLQNSAIRTELVQNLRNIGDSRRLRIVQSRDRLPTGLLEALVLGAIMAMGFVFLFGMKNAVQQMAMTVLMAGSIGLFFGLVLELSTPYSGSIHVSDDAWTYVIDNNHLIELAK